MSAERTHAERHAAPQVSANGHAPARPGADGRDGGRPGRPGGLAWEAQFAPRDGDVFDTVEWDYRDVLIKAVDGSTVFEQKQVHAPASWSDQAVQVVASKYFHGDPARGNDPATGGRESSVRQLIHRACSTAQSWGLADGYFASGADAERFGRDLAWLCLHQHATFNSPVWFNLGLGQVYGLKGDTDNFVWDHKSQSAIQCKDSYINGQSSACFIQPVEDSIEGIMSLAASEARLFKGGSGTGTDLSTLRSSREQVKGGGKASGPVSFMRVWDSVAGTIKSGGRSRRAAKIQTLRCDHPDVREFIVCKRDEDRKARALIASGAGRPGMTGAYDEAYSSVMFQNSNVSVRLLDAFLGAAEVPGTAWQTRPVLDSTADPMPSYDASELLDLMAECTWECGDPGYQFHDTINSWNTTPNSGEIRSSNPCAEYNHVDNSACNLASLNLMKFRFPDGPFDVPRFKAGVRTMVVAQDILLDRASYPTAAIAETVHRFRQLGLNHSNLGALLMTMGLPYDSDDGRTVAGAVTAIMHGAALEASAELAEVLGPFDEYGPNRGPMQQVIRRHHQAAVNLFASVKERSEPFYGLAYAGVRAMEAAAKRGSDCGFRNAQSTLEVPNGTTGFMMDCDTFGIEPELGLMKYKNLAGGGTMRITNRSVEGALIRLGYSDRQGSGFPGVYRRYLNPPTPTSQVDDILDYVQDHGKIEGAPHLKPEHLPVFDCSFEPPGGGRSIAPSGHVKMLAAVQPFLSGASSKCVTGDSIIATSNGLVRIASLYDGERPDSFRELSELRVPTGDGTMSTAGQFYYGGFRPTWKAVLADGRSITGTEPHRLRVATPNGLDWKAMPDLQPGDFIGLALGSHCWGSRALPDVKLSSAYGSQNAFNAPSVLTPELGTFLGMLTADGHVTPSNYTIGFTKDSLEARSLFKTLLGSLFGLKARDVDDDRREGGPDGLTGVTIGSKSLMEWLQAIGWSKKQVPPCILSGTREAAVGYLSGLYLDGYITRADDVAIGQKHRSLLCDVQALWDNLDVATYFSDNYVNEVNYPVLHAVSASRYLMANLITWIEPHKAALAAALRQADDRRPFPLRRPELESAIRDLHLTQKFRSVFDRRTFFLGRNTFLEAAEAVGMVITPEERNLVYVPMVSVEYAGEQEVFDLSVPGPEAFVANGIVNHNTVNLPNSATPADIRQVVLDAWKLGVKALAVYRDGSKGAQPLSTGTKAGAGGTPAQSPAGATTGQPGVPGTVPSRPHDPARPSPQRRRLPDTRDSLTHKFCVAGHEGYLTVGLYPDGSPGEVFLRMAKEGSTVGGLMDAVATSVSLGLQYGVPLDVYAHKFARGRYEPAGPTHNPELPFASSLTDYVFRWLASQFPHGGRPAPGAGSEDIDVATWGKIFTPAAPVGVEIISGPAAGLSAMTSGDTPACPDCGTLTVRRGTCCHCPNCSWTGGCGG